MLVSCSFAGNCLQGLFLYLFSETIFEFPTIDRGSRLRSGAASSKIPCRSRSAFNIGRYIQKLTFAIQDDDLAGH